MAIEVESVLLHSALALSTRCHSDIDLWWSREPPFALDCDMVKTDKTSLQYVAGGMSCLL